MSGKMSGIIAACRDGGLPPNVAAMQLMMEADSPEEAAAALGRETAESGPVDALRTLVAGNAGAWRLVREVLARAVHAGDPGGGDDPVAHWRGVFDALARERPEGGVALYALGSPEILAAATDEVVALLEGWGAIGPDRDVLEIGCGIGRFVGALASRVRSVTGLDVSGEMIAEARRRHGRASNVRLERSSGRDLSGIGSGRVDLVLAADVFPYLVGAGHDLAARHVDEARRVLRPGGSLAIFNFAYGAEPERSADAVARLFVGAGLVPERLGSRDLSWWDAPAFVGRVPPAG